MKKIFATLAAGLAAMSLVNADVSAFTTMLVTKGASVDDSVLIAPERSDALNYHDKPCTKPIGHIPQLEHTYAYIDSDYGVMNEHGLMLGECTDRSDHLPVLAFKAGGGIFSARNWDASPWNVARLPAMRLSLWAS